MQDVQVRGIQENRDWKDIAQQAGALHHQYPHADPADFRGSAYIPTASDLDELRELPDVAGERGDVMGIPAAQLYAARPDLRPKSDAKPPRRKRGTGRVSQAKRAFAATVHEIPPGTRAITIPLRTVSEANARDHWGRRAARAKRQREVTAMFVRRMDLPAMPVCVRLVRIGRRMLDSDNLAGSAKAVRDGIADVYGVDDGSGLYRWEYAQEVGDYGVRIEIEAGDGKDVTG